MDILTAWAKLESCDKLPTVVINAIDLCKIPKSHPEELNNITLIDRLNRMETRMSQMQAGLDEVVARNLMFNDKLNEMSSYASKVKASTVFSQTSHLSPAETARKVEQTHTSNTLMPQRTQELVVDNAEKIKQNVDNDSFQQPAYVLKQQRRQQNRTAKMEVISGSLRNHTSVRGAPEPNRDLLIYRVDTDTKVEDLKTFIAEKGYAVRSLDVMSKPNSKWKSFKLTVPVSQYSSLFDSSLWPEGICVCHFWNRKEHKSTQES